MSDLVKRLRDKWEHSEEVCYAAADRIEMLEAALSWFVNGGVPLAPLTRDEYALVKEARAALGEPQT